METIILIQCGFEMFKEPKLKSTSLRVLFFSVSLSTKYKTTNGKKKNERLSQDRHETKNEDETDETNTCVKIFD